MSLLPKVRTWTYRDGLSRQVYLWWRNLTVNISWHRKHDRPG